MFNVFFLGPDVSGKNSVMHGLAKEFKYKPFMSPRSPICNIVYDTIFLRNKECTSDNLDLIKILLKQNTYFVLIEVKPEILVKRALARKEKHINTKEDFVHHSAVYKTIFEICKKSFSRYINKFITVDNSGALDKTVTTLKNEILKRELKKK